MKIVIIIAKEWYSKYENSAKWKYDHHKNLQVAPKVQLSFRHSGGPSGYKEIWGKIKRILYILYFCSSLTQINSKFRMGSRIDKIGASHTRLHDWGLKRILHLFYILKI